METLSPFILTAKYEVSDILFLLLIVELKIRDVSNLLKTTQPVSGETKFTLGLFNSRSILNVLELKT